MDSSQPRYDTHPLPRSVKAPSRWSTRIIPIVLLGILAFASWVETFKIWFEATTQVHISQRTADALLAIYYLLLVVMILDYCRVYITINTNPGATPTNDLHTTGGPGIPTDYKNAVNPPSPCLLLDRLRERKPKEPTDQLVIRKFRYEFTSPGAAVDPENRLSIVGNAEPPSRLGYFPSRHHMDEYYTKDVFVCDPSGLPLWCNKCRIWKPDRAHHSSEMERCIRKMDHYCPWVGGMVSETSFNFFFHFTLWATIYCAFVLATSSYVMALRTNAGMPVDPAIAVAMGLSAFFGLFTATMTGGSLRFILLNLTNVEALAEKSKAYYLAIRIPNGSPPSDKYQIRTYPLADFHQRGQEGVSDPPVEHTFAIVKTEKGENPWNCGYYSNWVSVMGKNPIGWFFPVWHSPCMEEDGTKSQYKMGPLVEDLRARFGVAPPTMG